MDDDMKVFGPLNLKQLIRVTGAAGLAYIAYNFLPPNISIPIIVVAAFIFLSAFVNNPTVVIDEEYLKRKRFNCKNLEEFQRWLHKKIAEIQSYIHIRESRGLPIDEKLTSALKMFETALRDIK